VGKKGETSTKPHNEGTDQIRKKKPPKEKGTKGRIEGGTELKNKKNKGVR